jgi:hypothetical protein
MNEVLRHNRALSLYNSQTASSLESLCSGNDQNGGGRSWRGSEDLQPSGVGVTLSYASEGGIVRAVLGFNEAGKIQYCLCGTIE